MVREQARILVVDDDPTVRDVLLEIFARTGSYVVDSAENGRDGMDKVRGRAYDMVFTDLTMPGMNGIDFLRAVKQIRPTLPVVVITGYSSIENAVNAMKEGARDFISKPFNVGTVTAVADRVIGEARLLGSILLNSNYESFIGQLNAQLFKKLQEISVLQSISSEIDGMYDNKEIYRRVVEMAARLLLVREASFGIVEKGLLRLRSAVGVQERDIPLAGTIYERAVSERNYVLAGPGEPNPHTGAPLTSSFLAIPFMMSNEVFGIISLSGKDDGAAFTQDEVSLALTFVKKAAQRIENNALYDVLYHNLFNTLRSLVNSIEARDSYTRQHSERVTACAVQIGEAMNLSAEERDAIRFGGYLHDIGKIGVRDTVLLKPGVLTSEELSEIRLHPVIGGNIIKPIRFFPKEREMILHHHERFDGRGYPQGLEGERIPLNARILAVADTYDAMTTSRPYRAARTHALAVEELNRCAGTQFDAAVVKAFFQTGMGKGEAYGTD